MHLGHRTKLYHIETTKAQLPTGNPEHTQQMLNNSSKAMIFIILYT